MSGDPRAALEAALADRYAIERELGSGGWLRARRKRAPRGSGAHRRARCVTFPAVLPSWYLRLTAPTVLLLP